MTASSVPALPELDLLDLTWRPFRWRMGLRPLDLADWILTDRRYDADLAEKRRLYAESSAQVVASVPGTEPAAAEVLEALCAHLVVLDPVRFGVSAAALRASLPGAHPIEQAGLLVQEDLCLHTVVDGRLVLSAASLCFPTRWRLSDKIGRPVAEIHEPVPRYAGIAASVDRVLARLRVDRPVCRTNWSVLDDPALHQPPARERETVGRITGVDAGERLWLRVERQTLRRFPEHDSVLFTIRVFQRSFAELAARPDIAAWLAASIAALPDDVARYKGIAPFGAGAVEYLERLATSDA
ncbi:MAG: DUF3445 domain-containing protein [Acidimicrobiia bacterium]